MSSLETMSDEQFERHALGYSAVNWVSTDLARFLRLDRSGTGDHTKDRTQRQEDLTIEQIVHSIKHRRKS